MPISEKYADYAKKLSENLNISDIRGLIDNRDEKIGKKIRDAEIKKIPFMLIVGEKEQEENTVSVRKHGAGDLGSLTLDQFVEIIKTETAI
ncbi:Threonine--tRNA ligase 1 [compost metagenome]